MFLHELMHPTLLDVFKAAKSVRDPSVCPHFDNQAWTQISEITYLEIEQKNYSTLNLKLPLLSLIYGTLLRVLIPPEKKTQCTTHKVSEPTLVLLMGSNERSLKSELAG